MWLPPEPVPDGSPPPHVFFIGFRVRKVVQYQWEDGGQSGTVLLSDADPDFPIKIESFAIKGDELLSEENVSFATISRLLSMMGVPSSYRASVVQVIHSKAAAMVHETTQNGPPVTAIVAEIPLIWFWSQPEPQQSQEEGDENEGWDDESDDYEDSENEVMEEDMEIDMEMEMVVPAAAAKASVEALERFKLKGLNSMNTCVICLEQLSSGNEVTRMPCAHVFHADCIVQWLKNSHVCPLCRFKMPVDRS